MRAKTFESGGAIFCHDEGPRQGTIVGDGNQPKRLVRRLRIHRSNGSHQSLIGRADDAVVAPQDNEAGADRTVTRRVNRGGGEGDVRGGGDGIRGPLPLPRERGLGRGPLQEATQPGEFLRDTQLLGRSVHFPARKNCQTVEECEHKGGNTWC